MPMYAYRCEACGAEEEHLQKFSDPPMTECERCGGALSKLLTPAAFHLKGGGWYKDGYASAKPEGGKSGEATGEGGSSDKGKKSSSDKSSGDKSGGDKSGGDKSGSSGSGAKAATG